MGTNEKNFWFGIWFSASFRHLRNTLCWYILTCHRGWTSIQDQKIRYSFTHKEVLFPNVNVEHRYLTPVAGLFLTRLGFENIFKTHWVFEIRRSALLAITCSKYRKKFKLTRHLEEKLCETSFVWWNLLGWQIWTFLFEIEPWKVKSSLKAPKKSWNFWKFLWVFEPNRVEPSSRECLNYSNITKKRSLISKTHCVLKNFLKPRRVKNQSFYRRT